MSAKYLIFTIVIINLVSFYKFRAARAIGTRCRQSEKTSDRKPHRTGHRQRRLHGYAPLKNPPNDAVDMTNSLKSLGFEVLNYTNLDQNGMKRAIRDFGAKLRVKGGVGLFYYAGHGIQVKGTNYLIPVKANVSTEEEIEYESVEVGFVHGANGVGEK